ncbi:type II toxin-antitoxin system ParD family antitoxin [Glacieibacterium frigidum]|uniref:Type II toxin-antitoxin system ParD family antitoxin n=1 Tax=Glacieibacterium frigidum TaxID=2593303 RepID=A0A552UIY0_9SPHN|nr:type II toxin-antitoxin system ParD family antitoxin [Glacieibacterium frigidum]TRW18179.1 type II toxin-antitoxin system ParD family antitoxin [Glacieibacterium frigidum]
MDVAIGARWQLMVDGLVRNGRYSSAEDVVTEGLRLVSQHEDRLAALKTKIALSIARGGASTDEEVEAAIEAKLASMSGLAD